jgi:hypothetical protein
MASPMTPLPATQVSERSYCALKGLFRLNVD